MDNNPFAILAPDIPLFPTPMDLDVSDGLQDIDDRSNSPSSENTDKLLSAMQDASINLDNIFSGVNDTKTPLPTTTTHAEIKEEVLRHLIKQHKALLQEHST